MNQFKQAKRAQFALFSIFASFGVVVGIWSATIPILQKLLSLSNDILGMCILCFGLGAMLAIYIVPKYIARHQTRRVMLVTGCAMWLFFPLVVSAPSLSILMPALVALGLACGSLDVSINSHAFNIEHHLEKPVMSMLHGGFSLGNICGSALAALFIHFSWNFNWSVFGVAMLLLIGIIWAASKCYQNDIQPNVSADAMTSTSRAPNALIIVAGLTAICFFAEGAIGDWAGLFMRDIKSASPPQTALSLGAFALGMMIARFLGDSLRTRFATLPLLFASCAFATLMLLCFMFAPNPPLALLALVCAGLGYANIVPLLFIRAATIDGVPAARGVAFAAGMGYASLLGGPALLGYMAAQFGLMWSMAIVVFGTFILAIESRWQWTQSKLRE